MRGKELTFRWLAEEVVQRRQPGQPLICLSDGDAALHRMQEDHLPGAVCVLDLYHATERLWDAAHCLHPEGSQEANNSVEQRLLRVLAKGYPIGSGVAEGACRHLVKDRMEGTGMRWRVSGAQAMLHLRAVWLNDDWEAFQHRRAQEEQRLLHPYRSFVQQQWERKAA